MGPTLLILLSDNKSSKLETLNLSANADSSTNTSMDINGQKMHTKNVHVSHFRCHMSWVLLNFN